MRISKQVLTGSLVRTSMKSPVGMLDIVASDTGIRAVLMEKDLESDRCSTMLATIPCGKTEVLAEAMVQLKQYFSGDRREFSLPLDLVGTAFQIKVWRSLLKIQYGQTKTYSWQADRIKNPLAVRAVGTANGSNPIGIVVPCHRVIRKDNDLAGYGGGLDVKKALLKLEDALPGTSHSKFNQ